MKRVWTREKGLIVPTAALPLDWHKIEEWLVFVVKGLAWHHWKILIGAGCTFDVHALTQRGEALYQRLFIMRAAQRIPLQNLGAGTFSYEASQGIDTPEISVWTFSLYGGVTLADDETAPGQTVSKIGVMVGPNRVFEKARLAAN